MVKKKKQKKTTKKKAKQVAKKKVKQPVKKKSRKATRKPVAKKRKTQVPVASRPSSPLIADVEYIMNLMSANDISEIEIDDGEVLIAMKKGGVAVTSPPVDTPPVPATVSAVPVTPDQEGDADNLVDMVSPIVGTFFAAPSPDSAAFVNVGDRVNSDTVVCIIEAMKVMNEIKAECKGTVTEVCVENAEPVEFGQVLFRITPE